MRENPLRRQQSLSIAQRRNQVAAFMLGGVYDQRVIASKLGVAQSTISKDIRAIEDMWHAEMISKVDRAKARDVMRIEQAITAIWPRVMRADLDACRELVRLMGRKASMLGYDAPKVIDLRTALEREVKKAAIEYGLDADAVLAEADAILAGETT